MNILVLGNGFDLAHGLKTSYENFLEAVEITDDLIECQKELRIKKWDFYDKAKIPQSLCEELNKIVKTKKYETNELKEFHSYWRNNFWFKYFKEMPGGTWIDFERDIKEVCQSIEKKIYNGGMIRKFDQKIDLDKEFSEYVNYLDYQEGIDSLAGLIQVLEVDLKHVINSLDIYIYRFINSQECEAISPDIISLDIDKVISFNYSTTYQNSYNVAPNTECIYIHGEAGKQRNNEYGNLVLGFEETKEKNNDDMMTTFVSFKKYYQRVLKGTGNEYVKWVNEIQADRNKEHRVYFFGHSMDITDKDIIKALILNSNVKTTIYFYSNQDKMGKLKNLVSVLGYDDFIEYTRNGRIEFVKQSSFEEKKYSREYKGKIAVKNLYDFPYLSARKYNSICEWFDSLEYYPDEYKITYFYLAIDAMQKYKVETDKVEKLKKICYEHCGDPCSYDDFLNIHAIYCDIDTKFENNELKNFITTIYEKRVSNKENWHYEFLERIKLDRRTLNRIYMGTTSYLYVDLKKLIKVTDCFLDTFDKAYSYKKIYDDMVKFLHLVEPDLVEELFSSMLNDPSLTGIRQNQLEILLSRYNSIYAM